MYVCSLICKLCIRTTTILMFSSHTLMDPLAYPRVHTPHFRNHCTSTLQARSLSLTTNYRCQVQKIQNPSPDPSWPSSTQGLDICWSGGTSFNLVAFEIFFYASVSPHFVRLCKPFAPTKILQKGIHSFPKRKKFGARLPTFVRYSLILVQKETASPS